MQEVPEVVGSLTNLRELWMDQNRIKELPASIGNLTRLVHLETSLNHISNISESIGACVSLTDLAVTTNDLKVSSSLALYSLDLPHESPELIL